MFRSVSAAISARHAGSPFWAETRRLAIRLSMSPMRTSRMRSWRAMVDKLPRFSRSSAATRSAVLRASSASWRPTASVKDPRPLEIAMIPKTIPELNTKIRHSNNSLVRKEETASVRGPSF